MNRLEAVRPAPPGVLAKTHSTRQPSRHGDPRMPTGHVQLRASISR
jgi:hypothetical protein